MKALTNISLIILLSITTLPMQAEAKSKSFSVQVSCTVPAQLELYSPINETGHIHIEEKIKDQPLESTYSEENPYTKIQTQQIRYQGKQKQIIYTIIER